MSPIAGKEFSVEELLALIFPFFTGPWSRKRNDFDHDSDHDSNNGNDNDSEPLHLRIRATGGRISEAGKLKEFSPRRP